MRKGFTLIELLVTIMIIGILVTIATFGVRQAQESARDGKRKTDLENIAVALELYRAECNRYPNSISFGGNLSGGGSPSSCTGAYMNNIPVDPQNPSRRYSYSTSGGATFVLCAALEQSPNPSVSTSGCGSCGQSCNWRVSRP